MNFSKKMLLIIVVIITMSSIIYFSYKYITSNRSDVIKQGECGNYRILTEKKPNCE